jgi:NhaP-type Na+/H+ or K+/H+ antiporter
VSQEGIILSLVSIVALGVSAQWLAARLRLPSILLLLLFGFIAGPVTHLVAPDALLGQLLLPLVSLAVDVLLFEGGLSLRLTELAQISGVVRNLVTVGVLVTWVLSAAAAWLFFGHEPRLAIFLGALLVVSGPTVVGPLLQQIRPKGRVAAILKWEAILIDPLGVVLALLTYHVVFHGESGTVGLRLLTTVVGGGIGLVSAALLTLLFRRYLVPDYLHNPVVLLFVLLSFTAANAVQSEAGLLAVVLMGVALANQKSVSVRHIIAFKENLRVLLLAALFIVLAARLQWDDLQNAGLASLAYVAVLIVVVRPLAVLVSTLRTDLSVRERLFLAWVAPRGIVAAATASVFSLTLVYKDGYANGHAVVPITFAVIIGTVAVYGLAAGTVARLLGLAEPDPQGVLIVGAHAPARAIACVLQAHGFPVLLLDEHRSQIVEAHLEGLPAHAGSIHHDRLPEELDLTGIGRLLALSPLESVDVVAVERFREVFGRANVYQLPPEHEPGKKHESPELQGRLLFSRDLPYAVLEERFRGGAVLKATPLTATFTYRDFEDQFGKAAVLLFVIAQTGRLLVVSADQAVQPQPGQTFISLVSQSDKASV